MAEIVPSILSNDPSDFRHKMAQLLPLSHYFRRLHIDFIDGIFLPNKTLIPQYLQFIKSPYELIAHVMAANPGEYISSLAELGFRTIILQFEATPERTVLVPLLDRITKLRMNCGLAINPETQVHTIGGYLRMVNIIQVMSVHPGAQGRPFESNTLDKIRELRKLKQDLIISVDGGIRVGNARSCVEAGANVLVVGSGIWRSEDIRLAFETLMIDIE
jgi:ribulose-phosphate 3-epimerase